MLKRMLLSLALVTLSVSAQAESLCNAAPKLLKCFHPTARLSGCQSTGSTPTSERGLVYFTGGLTHRPYVMDVQLDYRVAVDQQTHEMIKATLWQDNAMMPPARCPLLGWTSLN